MKSKFGDVLSFGFICFYCVLAFLILSGCGAKKKIISKVREVEKLETFSVNNIETKAQLNVSKSVSSSLDKSSGVVVFTEVFSIVDSSLPAEVVGGDGSVIRLLNASYTRQSSRKDDKSFLVVVDSSSEGLVISAVDLSQTSQTSTRTKSIENSNIERKALLPFPIWWIFLFILVTAAFYLETQFKISKRVTAFLKR